jgi:hypothetical protein
VEELEKRSEQDSLEKRVRILEANNLVLEEAMDASIAERKMLRSDLDIVTEILTKLIRQLHEERDEREAMEVREDEG